MSPEITIMLEKHIESSSLGLALIDSKGVIEYANPKFCKLLAFSSSDAAKGCSLVQHVAATFYSSIADLVPAIKSHDASTFRLHLNRDEEALNFQIDNADNELRLLVVDDLLKSATTLVIPNSTAFQDALTGLGNRMLLSEVISNWQPRAPEALSLAAIMIDLDHFKQVNDTLGHGAGDTLLKLVAKRIKSATRKDDPVIRMAGNEFIVLHTIGLQPEGAESVSKRIVELMGRPFLIEGQQVNISASVGLAILNHGTNHIDDLLKHAGLALYEAKALGRGTVKLFEPELATRAMQRRDLEIDLRRALGLREFVLYYQPQVKMPEGRLQGFEALVRWQNPKRGMVPPLDFIPLAEATGEIHAIGEWILRTACKEAVNWDGDFTVAVNISPIQFESDRILNIIEDALTVSGLPPNRLELEITESTLVKDDQNTQQQLWAIKQMGVGIALDDFGTGYSSLSYLSNFPFSKIKIDQSFVRGESSLKSRALVQAIISLGKSLNMTTIAEGVETEEQYNELSAEGCMAAQGYLISRPIPVQEIAPFIAKIKPSQFKWK